MGQMTGRGLFCAGDASLRSHAPGAERHEPHGPSSELGWTVPAAETGSSRVLVVEDDAGIREYLRRLLSQRWTVDVACDGHEALAVARATLPDLVLTEGCMPGLDGFDLIRALRSDERTKAIRVMMVMAHACEETLLDALDAGADDYVIEPFGAREIVARVKCQLLLARSDREHAKLVARERLARGKAERTSARLRDEAEAASRTMERLLDMLGHELRGPLSPMLATLELMRLRGAQSREQEVLEKQVSRLLRLLDELFELARVESYGEQRVSTEMELAHEEIAPPPRAAGDTWPRW